MAYERPMKTNQKVRGLGLALIIGMAGSVWVESGFTDGIPEPSIIFYGTIRNRAVHDMIQTSGNLTWQIRNVADNRTITLSPRCLASRLRTELKGASRTTSVIRSPWEFSSINSSCASSSRGMRTWLAGGWSSFSIKPCSGDSLKDVDDSGAAAFPPPFSPFRRFFTRGLDFTLNDR